MLNSSLDGEHFLKNWKHSYVDVAFKLLSLCSCGTFLRSENKNKRPLKSQGRMEVKPIKNQSVCSQALRRNWWLWSPPFCGQDGEPLLAALDLCLLYSKSTFLQEKFIHYGFVLRKRTSAGALASQKNKLDFQNCTNWLFILTEHEWSDYNSLTSCYHWS